MAHRSDRHGGAVKRRAGVPAATPASTETPRDAATDERAHPLAKWWAYAAVMRALKFWDAMATWKRYGFVPPTEYRNDYRFKVNREGGGDDYR